MPRFETVHTADDPPEMEPVTGPSDGEPGSTPGAILSMEQRAFVLSVSAEVIQGMRCDQDPLAHDDYAHVVKTADEYLRTGMIRTKAQLREVK